MLLNNVITLLSIALVRFAFSNDDLCRLIEFDTPQSLGLFGSNEVEEKLFYKTNFVCQNKPVFRSLNYPKLYQFQSPNNRWWSLYDTTNSTSKLGMREWCDAWNVKPLLSMPLGMFQHPLGKQKRSQRWQRVMIHEKNNSYSYKPISNVHLKCYHPPSTSNCPTRQLTFLFDLTATTTDDEFHQMQLLTKTLIWLLYNDTSIALSSYRDRFHLIHSFDNKTSSKSLEHLFDSIDSMNQQIETAQRNSVHWPEAIHSIVTQIYNRRFLLPVKKMKSIENDSIDDEDEIYTEPYDLIPSDEHSIKTILNITTHPYRDKRAIKTQYNKSHHVLVILTSRSKSLYDYKQRDKDLAEFIITVPLRIVVIDFNKISNSKIAEYIHSAFIHNAQYALASSPATYNYIETYEEYGDVIHGNQLFDHYQRLCHSTEENFNFTRNLIEINNSSMMECSLLTLFDNQEKILTLKEKLQYTFYQTSDRCFSAPVYRSLSDRNLYVQKIASGRWLIIRVDPLLPSTASILQGFASTTTTTLAPEFLYATDYANGPLIDDINNGTSIIDLPISVPHCSNTPGIDTIWESDDSLITNEYSLHTPRQWISNSNQSDLVSPICNKYKISCKTNPLDILILIDIQHEYLSLIQTLLNIFLTLIDPSNHRFSLIILSSRTIDTFQYHLPLTSLNTLNNKIIENFFTYLDHENNSIIKLNEHLQRISEYLLNNRQSSKQIILTISSRLNFNSNDMKKLIQSYSTIRYMALDTDLKTNQNFNQKRENLLRSLTSIPSYTNLFWSYSAYRDLTFNTVFRILETLCGYV